MALVNEKIREFWHQRAAIDDPSAARFHAEHTRIDLETITPLCPPGAKVLDLGCGTCIIANSLAGTCGAQVHAVDFEPGFLRHAAPNVTTETGRAQDYLSDETFDLILSMGVINFLSLEDRTRMYENCRAMLKDNGVFFLKAQFGCDEQVNVDHHSDELGAHYQAVYPHLASEQVLLGDYYRVSLIDPYPSALNRHSNTHFYYLICRQRRGA